MASSAGEKDFKTPVIQTTAKNSEFCYNNNKIREKQTNKQK